MLSDFRLPKIIENLSVWWHLFTLCRDGILKENYRVPILVQWELMD